MTALTLPGTIPGLLRRGSPVMYEGDEPKSGVIVGIGYSEAVLEAFEARERKHGSRVAP